jgi:F420-dependent oxidoreductase-like protein
MRIGILGLGHQYSIADTVAGARLAADEGFDTYWLPGEVDPISALVAAGREVPNIKLATSVIPIYSRHPVAMAAEALMANEALDGRFILGLGLSHKPIVETKWGQPFDRPVRLLREYLSILIPLLDHREADFTGEMLSGKVAINARNAPRPQVLIAAMGPQTLKVTGRLADGTDTWMTGQRTLSDLTVPTITAAAREAGRPAPVIAVGLPICVTSDLDRTRADAEVAYGHHATFPTYRAMLDREGKSTPGDLAIIGDEASVREQLLAYRKTGVTDLIASPFGSSDDQKRTRGVLRELAQELAPA